MRNIDEDLLRDHYDMDTTHNDPHSPWYDGPMVGDDMCEHGVLWELDCKECEAEDMEEEEEEETTIMQPHKEDK
jgi:hypothetical protein